MSLAKKILEKYASFSEDLSQDDLDIISDQLVNNEYDSDEDLVKFLAGETSVKPSDLKKLIKAERSNFLGPKYARNKDKDNEKIIRKYIK